MAERKKGEFSSRFGFLMATVGSAVGLDNLWSYPYKMGKNGGAVFLFIYLILTVLVGVVLMLAELGLGRRTGRGVVYAYREIDKKFTFVGIFGWLAPLLILGFYTMLGGFCIKYTVVNLGDFLGASWGLGAADSSAYFAEFSADGIQTVVFTLIFILVTMIIVGAGITDGIEKFSVVAMPMLFGMLVIVIIRSVTLPGAGAGLSFIFKPDLSAFRDFGWISVLSAAGGQMFFSLSIGMGINITYGSYMKKEDDLVQSAWIIPIADTLVAVLAALATMPAVFSAGLDPAQGPGMLFVTLQTVFKAMGRFGALFGVIFYALVFIAAITSSIALAETVVSSLIDWQISHKKPHDRRKITILVGLAVAVMGVFISIDGLGTQGLPQIFGQSCWLDSFDLVSEGILLPLGSLILALILGWIRPHYIDEEFERNGETFALKNVWQFCIRYIVPPIMVFILLGQISAFFGLGWF